MSTGSKIGKVYPSQAFIKDLPDNLILVEAALRRGQPLTPLIEPQSPAMSRVDIGKWKLALQAAQNVDSPNRNQLYEVFDNIMIDNTLTSIIDTRILKAVQSKFMIYDKEGNPDLEAKELFEREWFNKFIRHAMTANFEGPVLIETFDFDTETGELKDCVRVNKYHVKPELGIVTKEPTDDKGWPFVDNPYYIMVGDVKDYGILYKAAPHVLAKKFALGTWAEFNEKIGIPFRTVNTNSTDAKRKQQLGVIMDKMGSAGWAVLNEGEKVELLAITGTDPTKCFEQLCVKLDSETAMLILGQSMTSNSQSNKGTYGSMQVLQEISEDRHESDLTSLKYLINGVLMPRLIELSPAYKGLTDRYFDWDKSEELNIADTIKYVVDLSAIYDIDPEFVTQKTGIPIIGLKSAATISDPKVPLKKKA